MTNHRPQPYGGATGPRWIFSYADMMTILLVLFVAISAQGLRRIEARSRQAVTAKPPATEPARKPAAAEPPADLERARRILEERGLKPKLEARGVVVSLPQAVLFASGQDRVNAAALPMVGQIAEAIRGLPNRVTLVGYADAVPIHNRRFRDNWALSVDRGLSLLEVLTERYGIPQSRLSVSGFGSYSPREPNDTAANRAANRRVELVILREPWR
jgi:chemotaxis protein MotB